MHLGTARQGDAPPQARQHGSMNLRWRSAARGQHRAPRFAQQLSQNTGLPPETYAAAIICKRTATHAACAHHLASRHAHAGKKEKVEERVERAPIPN
jgi:hypothetical protein